MHRFVALFALLSSLHLMLVGGDAACLSHEALGTGSMAEMPMAHHAGSETGQAAASGGAHAAPDCAAPAPGRCCEAMSSCSVTTVVAVSGHAASYALLAGAQQWRTLHAMPWARVAPEPPPPKA